MTRYPALAEWRAELRAGLRSPTTFDVLWKAACCEAWAVDCAVWGLPTLAAGFRKDAQRMILAAAAEEAWQRQRGSGT